MSLNATLQKMKASNSLEVLGITERIEQKDMQSIKRKLTLQFHPDRHEESERDIAEEITSIVNNSIQDVLDNWEEYMSSFSSETGEEEEKVIKKGINFMSLATLLPKDLEGGATVEVEPYEVANQDPIEITIPPNTLDGTVLVFKGLGEQSTVMNGDLIVLCKAVSSNTTESKKPSYVNDLVFCKVASEVGIGNNKRKLNGLNKSTTLNKLDSSGHSLIITDEPTANGKVLVVNY